MNVETLNQNTRILSLFREYQDVKVEFNNFSSEAEEDHEVFYAQLDAIGQKLMSLPCTCAADFAAKTIIDTCDGGLSSDWKLGDLWKEARDLVGMPLLGLNADDHKAARMRLVKFAEWTETKAPSEMLDGEGAPTDELLAYCTRESLSLDWLFLGDERGLVLRLRSGKDIAA